ncbi:MAG: AAA family ATPase [Pseudonocardiaceae bacterium]|nr:AAA family ATPase [Pseudonocardiaceae bacterium]
MRIGVSGKGGVGKTTVCAVLSRTLRGHQVIAIDCDSDPNLATTIGIGEDGSARLRPILDQSGPARHLPDGFSPDRLLREYGHC